MVDDTRNRHDFSEALAVLQALTHSVPCKFDNYSYQVISPDNKTITLKIEKENFISLETEFVYPELESKNYLEALVQQNNEEA